MQRTGLVAIVLASVLSCPAYAGPTPGTRGIATDDAACASARTTLDTDRGRMEALMLSMSDQDQKPESPARFKRMCAIDGEISVTAARLAKAISSAPGACLSEDDRQSAAEMQRLSKPIPECKATASGKAGADKKIVATARQPGKEPVKRPSGLPTVAAPTAKSTAGLPLVAPGLMADLY
jgi:hypothetical protein